MKFYKGEKMKDLSQIRVEIDQVDDQIKELYLKRMGLAEEVANQKKQTGKGVTDIERENAVVYRLAKDLPDNMKLYLKELYSTIFNTGKAYQSTIIGKSSQTINKLEEILKGDLENFPITASVACQGIKGANSGVATHKLFPVSDIIYFRDFDGVFNAVEKGFCEYGVLPIENSTAGSVSEVYDLMKKHNFYIVRSIRVRIDHCLCAKEGADIKNIKKVISHSQALSQCQDYLKNLKVETESCENTAVAGKKVADGDDLTVAAICSYDCAEAYGLKVLDKSVQDNLNNFTRFICISKELKIFSGADRISVMTSLSHKPGSLNAILARFSALGLNLTKIESRPIANSEFEFMFYFDFEGNVKDIEVKNVISELENGSDKFVFLGSYKEIL
ncbi:MAG: bifunctional chorismate mutase/prephenate dehydratase [Clostridia bacterium]|nr:bifunctional chorismate mutase/prephenate dehydratase [Clostridia bacterium]